MTRITLPLLFALSGCTIIVDDDPPTTLFGGEETAPAEADEEETAVPWFDLPPELIACSWYNYRDVFLAYAVECPEGSDYRCSLGDSIVSPWATVCCDEAAVGASCVFALPPLGSMSSPECEPGLVEICDYFP